MQARFTWGIVVSAGAALTLALLSSAQADPKLAINHQGVERLATLHRPQAIASVPSPLVVALHGLGQSVESLQEWLHLDAASDREKFSVVYPEAIGRKWSYGRPIDGPMPTVNGKTVDDVGFIRTLIDGLVNMKVADPTRIYVTGMSRGGLMTYTLMCALADRIAAAAPLISGMTDHQREDCRPKRPVPMMVVAGTNDESQWYDGVVTPAGRLLSIPETMEYWRVRNGCTEETASWLPHRDESDPTRVRLFEWSKCRNNAQLKLYRISDGGHQLPSFAKIDEHTTKLFGLRNHDIETADEIAKFVMTASLAKQR